MKKTGRLGNGSFNQPRQSSVTTNSATISPLFICTPDSDIPSISRPLLLTGHRWKMRRPRNRLGPGDQLAILDPLLAADREMLDHSLPPPAQLRFSFRIAGKIIQLVRVFLQVEQLLLAVIRMEDVLRAPVRETVPVVLAAVADSVFEVDIFPPGRSSSAQQGQHALSIESRACGRSGSIEKSRQYVPQFNGLGEHLATLGWH